MTVNGASIRTGDLYASGTVSGPGPGQYGSFMEMSWNGTRPLALPDGTQRGFLEDGDVVTLTAKAPGEDGVPVGFGSCEGRVLPALGIPVLGSALPRPMLCFGQPVGSVT